MQNGWDHIMYMITEELIVHISCELWKDKLERNGYMPTNLFLILIRKTIVTFMLKD